MRKIGQKVKQENFGAEKNHFAHIFEDALNINTTDENIKTEFEIFVRIGTENQVFTSGKEIALESDFKDIRINRDVRDVTHVKKIEQGYKKRDDLTHRELA